VLLRKATYNSRALPCPSRVPHVAIGTTSYV